jgi:hypothetical protein
MPVVKDRRSSPRVAIEGRARVLTSRARFEGLCVDLGLGGVAIRSTRAARPREHVTLELLVHGQLLRLEATVARRQREGGDYVLGFAVVDLDLDAQRRIEHLVFERLAGSPLAELMRAFVAHADRVPPPARSRTAEGTVVVGAIPVPVITGHTQIIEVGMLPTVDRTVIAPAPPRTETVLADPPPVADRTVLADAPRAPGVPDAAWLDDEMDTEQFRLLEAAQAREAEREREEPIELDGDEVEEEELEVLDADDPVPEVTVIVGGLPHANDPATGAGVQPRPLPRPPRERTLVTTDAPELPPRERTLVTTDAPELPPRERTLVTTDAPDERPHERTIPFLRDWLEPLAPRRDPAEHTVIDVGPTPAEVSAPTPIARALVEAIALLRPPGPAPGRRGPRVIVSVPHRTYRRIAPAPWNVR